MHITQHKIIRGERMTAWRAQIHHIWGTSCMVNEMGNAGQPAGNRTKMAAFNAHLLQPAATTWRYRCEGSGTSTQTGVSWGRRGKKNTNPAEIHLCSGRIKPEKIPFHHVSEKLTEGMDKNGYILGHPRTIVYPPKHQKSYFFDFFNF